VLDAGQSVASFTNHAGAATGLALHPCGDLLVSVGVDKSFVYYDLEKLTVISQVYTDSGMSKKALQYRWDVLIIYQISHAVNSILTVTSSQQAVLVPSRSLRQRPAPVRPLSQQTALYSHWHSLRTALGWQLCRKDLRALAFGISGKARRRRRWNSAQGSITFGGITQASTWLVPDQGVWRYRLMIRVQNHGRNHSGKLARRQQQSLGRMQSR
jgi:hypothetical protein